MAHPTNSLPRSGIGWNARVGHELDNPTSLPRKSLSSLSLNSLRLNSLHLPSAGAKCRKWGRRIARNCNPANLFRRHRSQARSPCPPPPKPPRCSFASSFGSDAALYADGLGFWQRCDIGSLDGVSEEFKEEQNDQSLSSPLDGESECANNNMQLNNLPVDGENDTSRCENNTQLTEAPVDGFKKLNSDSLDGDHLTLLRDGGVTGASGVGGNGVNEEEESETSECRLLFTSQCENVAIASPWSAHLEREEARLLWCYWQVFYRRFAWGSFARRTALSALVCRAFTRRVKR